MNEKKVGLKWLTSPGTYYARVNLMSGTTNRWAGRCDVRTILQQSAEEFEDGSERWELQVSVLGAEHLKDVDTTLDPEESFYWFIGSLFGFVLYICFGASIMALVEDRPFGDMVWMFVITVSTVG